MVAFAVDGATAELIFYLTMFFCFVIILSEAMRYAIKKQKFIVIIIGLVIILCIFAKAFLYTANAQFLFLALAIIGAICSVLW
jgi:hypothetical protein